MRRELPSDPLLFLREGAAFNPPEGAQARVAARFAASVAVISGGSSASSALAASGAATRGVRSAQLSGSTTRVLAERFVRWSLVPLGVGVALGAGGRALGGGGDLSPRPALPVAIATASAEPAASAPSVLKEPLAVADATAAPSASSPATKSTLTAERSVLDRARRELASSEPARALGFLEQHAREFPRGQLSEEREAMLVNVLVLLGRGSEAKARGESFAARFPNSLMGSSVRAALLEAERKE